MLLNEECPSWIYPIKMGATTTWERWDSILPDGSINPGEMTSFNHYALGSVATFLHEYVGGLKITEPGYKRFSIKPYPGGGLTKVSVKHDSPYGEISSTWEVSGKNFSLKVKIPLNTSATVELPDGQIQNLGSGFHVLNSSL